VTRSPIAAGSVAPAAETTTGTPGAGRLSVPTPEVVVLLTDDHGVSVLRGDDVSFPFRHGWAGTINS